MAYKNTRENLEMKKRKNIDVIKYGELHMYYPAGKKHRFFLLVLFDPPSSIKKDILYHWL